MFMEYVNDSIQKHQYLRKTRVERQVGMAWNVRENLMSFGVEVYILTQEERIIKRRFIDERYNQQLLRVDVENPTKPLDYDLPENNFDALVISDYDKGFITTERMFELVEWFDGPVFIDSKAAAIAVTHFGTYVLSERDVNEICD